MVTLDPAVFMRRFPNELSGGQQQRIGVARALAADPPVLLMDEPFGAIDPINREIIQDEFLKMQRKLGKTILFVSHDIDEAVKMRSEEHTSELQSLMRISYAVFCLKKKKKQSNTNTPTNQKTSQHTTKTTLTSNQPTEKQ